MLRDIVAANLAPARPLKCNGGGLPSHTPVCGPVGFTACAVLTALPRLRLPECGPIARTPALGARVRPMLRCLAAAHHFHIGRGPHLNNGRFASCLASALSNGLSAVESSSPPMKWPVSRPCDYALALVEVAGIEPASNGIPASVNERLRCEDEGMPSFSRHSRPKASARPLDRAPPLNTRSPNPARV